MLKRFLKIGVLLGSVASALLFFDSFFSVAPSSIPIQRSPAHLTCERELTAPTQEDALAVSKGLMGTMEGLDWSLRADETRLSANDQSGRSLAYKVEYQGYGDSRVLHLWSISYFKRQPQPNVQQPPNELVNLAFRNFRHVRDLSLEFVIDAYRKRRLFWPESFLTKLRKLAEEYEKESTYIFSQSRVVNYDVNDQFASHENSPMYPVGAIRLIHEKEGLLPMEASLGIRVQNPEGTLKVEPGNFAIDPTAGEIANIELSLSIISQIGRYQREFSRSPFFVTYADPYSERLYGSMGLKYLPKDQMQVPESLEPLIVEDVKTGAVRIKMNDVEWAPMYATAETMIDILHQRILKLANHYQRNQFIKNFEAIMQTIDMEAEAESFVGWSRNGEIFLNFDKSVRNEVAFTYQLPGDGNKKTGRETIYLPSPLTDGFSMTTDLGSYVSYTNGILLVSEVYDPSSTVSVRIDKDFKYPRSFERRIGGSIFIEATF